MKVLQKTLVEKMKPVYPVLTRPIASAAAHSDRSGIMYTPSFRRKAQEAGFSMKTDKDGRFYRNPHKVRLTDAEDESFRSYLESTGQTAQELLHKAVEHVIRGGVL